MTTARHIKGVYRIVNDEMLLYAGPLEIPVNGSTEVNEGDMCFSFSLLTSKARPLSGPGLTQLSAT